MEELLITFFECFHPNTQYYKNTEGDIVTITKTALKQESYVLFLAVVVYNRVINYTMIRLLSSN